MPRRLKYKHKCLPKIHVWGGISKEGATQLVMFSGKMNATKYGDIRLASLLPSIKECYPECHWLYQDKDSKHTSKYIQRFFENSYVNWWKRPAESPHLNPIEKVWSSMKTYLRDKHKSNNLVELKEGIRTYCKKLNPEVCNMYSDHLQKVMPIVAWTGCPFRAVRHILLSYMFIAWSFKNIIIHPSLTFHAV